MPAIFCCPPNEHKLHDDDGDQTAMPQFAIRVRGLESELESVLELDWDWDLELELESVDILNIFSNYLFALASCYRQ